MKWRSSKTLLALAALLAASAAVAWAFTMSSPGASVILGAPQGAGPPAAGALLQFNGTDWVGAPTPLSVANGGTGLGSLPTPSVTETCIVSNQTLTANTATTLITVGPLAALPASPTGKWLIHMEAHATFVPPTSVASDIEYTQLNATIAGSTTSRLAIHSFGATPSTPNLLITLPVSYDAIATTGDATVKGVLVVQASQADRVEAYTTNPSSTTTTCLRVVATPY